MKEKANQIYLKLFLWEVAPAFGQVTKIVLSFGNTSFCISSFPLKTFFFFSSIFSPFDLYPISAYVLVLFCFLITRAIPSYLLCSTTQFCLHYNDSAMGPDHPGVSMDAKKESLNRFLSKQSTESKYYPSVHRLLYRHQFPLQLGCHSLIRSLALSDVNHF